MTVINPHLEAEDPSRSQREEKRLNTQYQKRQRYNAKYGVGSMRSLRSYFRSRIHREQPELSFRKWLRSVDKWDGAFSPKAASIRAGS